MRNAVRNTRWATAATLAVALCVAVYLNWQYARTGGAVTASAGSETAAAASLGAAQETSAEAGAVPEAAADAPAAAQISADSAVTVSDGLMTEQEELEAANKNYGEAQLVSVSKDSGSAFFEQARLDRSKTRDAAVDQIEQSLKKSSLSDAEKKTLADQLTACLEDITAENEIETLVKAKGFADCLCFLKDNKADITVMTASGDGLNASQVAQIRDIVLGKCSDLSAQDITVVEVK